MDNMSATRPAADEYAPGFENYISLVPDGDVVSTLRRHLAETLDTLRGIDEEKANSRYAEGKWSIKELVGHVIDAERIFSYRALRFARNDQTPLPGFEQDDYIANARFDEYPLSELIAEFEHVRQGTLDLFSHLDAAAWARQGVASDNPVSVRALAYAIAGHAAHHMKILRERYL